MGDLFVISRADIFAIYPQILATILATENAKRNFIKDFINLPTDSDYQERVYYRLLAVQKAINDLMDAGALVKMELYELQMHFNVLFCVLIFHVYSSLDEIGGKKNIKTIWDPDSQFVLTPISSPSPASGFSLRRKKCVFDDPMDFLNLNELSSWSLFDLTTAAKLLRKPPIACTFSDEHEMRRVYSMIYDVYRCRSNLFKIENRLHK